MNFLKRLSEEVCRKALGVTSLPNPESDYATLRFQIKKATNQDISIHDIKLFFKSPERCNPRIYDLLSEYVLPSNGGGQNYQEFKKLEIKRDNIEKLRHAVWQKCVGNSDIVINFHYYNDISRQIAKGTGETKFDVKTIKNFFEKRNIPQQGTLNILARFVLDNRSVTFEDFVNKHPLPDPIIKAKTRRFNTRMLWIGGICIFIIVLILFITYCCLNTHGSKKIKITAYASLESKFLDYDEFRYNEDFISYLQHTFNEKSRKFRITIIREKSERNKESIRQIKTLLKEGIFNSLDVLIGGRPELHQIIKNKVRLNLDESYKSIPYWAISPDSTFVGFYTGAMGFAWNCNLIESGKFPLSFDSINWSLLESHHKDSTFYFAPKPSSSAGYYLFYHLGLKKNKHSLWSFDKDIASKKFKELYSNSNVLEDSTGAVMISKENLALEFVWLHDYIWEYGNTPGEFGNVRVAIPKDALPTMGCLSIYDRNDNQRIEGAQEFIRFLLSEEVQRKHYEMQKRIPIREDIRHKVLEHDHSPYAKGIKEMFNRISSDTSLPVNSLHYFKKNNSISSWVEFSKDLDKIMNNMNKSTRKDNPIYKNRIEPCPPNQKGWALNGE